MKLSPLILNIDERGIPFDLTDYYNYQDSCRLAQDFISKQNTLPFKLRYKCDSIHDFVLSLFNQIRLLFEKNSNMSVLCSHDRSILIYRQMKYVTLMNFISISQTTNLLEYLISFLRNSHFRAILMMLRKYSTTLSYFDAFLLRIISMIIMFSTSDYTIYKKISVFIKLKYFFKNTS